MVTALLYFLFVVGVFAAAAGIALTRYPEMFEDEAQRAFWGAIGSYIWLLGSVAAIFSALFLWS